jgi:hypothetical protein
MWEGGVRFLTATVVSPFLSGLRSIYVGLVVVY